MVLTLQISTPPEISSFPIFFILKEIPSFSKIWKFWAIKLKLSQLSSSFPSWKYLLKFSSFKNFWCGPLQLLSNFQLHPSWKRLSKFGRTVKFWCGGRSSCQKTPPPAKETKIREKRRIWRKLTEFDKWEKLEEKEIFGRIV